MAGDRVRIQIDMDAELLARIDTEARARVVGRRLLVDHLLRMGLAQLPPLPPACTEEAPDEQA